jgi:serine/threonine protein kinase
MKSGPKCPFLVRIFKVVANVGDSNDIYVVMECCEEGDLSKRIEKNIPPTDLVFLVE